MFNCHLVCIFICISSCMIEMMSYFLIRIPLKELLIQLAEYSIAL
jgi:hypothetical protein